MKKTFFSLVWLLGALVAFGPLSIDMYLPSLPQMSRDLNSSAQQVQATISIFLVGFSIGMLIYGPLSDFYGRKRVLMIGISTYVLASIGCSLSHAVEPLIVFRLLQALGGASASVIARALARDLYAADQTPRILSLMHIVTMLATLAAPTLGGLMSKYLGWNAIFYFLSGFSLLILCCVMWFIPNHPPQKPEHNIFKNYLIVLHNSKTWSFVLAMGGSFAGMFAYITASSFVFVDYYAFTQIEYSLVFAANIFSVIVFTSLNTYFLKTHSALQLLKHLTLIAFLSGVFLLSLSLLALDSALLIIIGLWVFVGVTGSIGANSIANLLHLFPHVAGTASGIAVFFQFSLGALASYCTTLLFIPQSSLAMTLVIAICGSVSFFSLRLNPRLKMLESTAL